MSASSRQSIADVREACRVHTHAGCTHMQSPRRERVQAAPTQALADKLDREDVRAKARFVRKGEDCDFSSGV